MYFVYWIIFVNEGVKTFCNHLSFFLCLDISARCLLLLGILTYHTMMSTGVLSFSDISFTYVCTRSSVRPLFLPHERAVKNVNRFHSNKQFMRDFLLCISTFILPNKKKKNRKLTFVNLFLFWFSIDERVPFINVIVWRAGLSICLGVREITLVYYKWKFRSDKLKNA